MPRRTLAEVEEEIAQFEAQSAVYKAQLTEFTGYTLSRSYEAARDAIRDQFVNGGKWQTLTEAERAVEQALPYELRHLYGKKFTTILDNTPVTEFTREVRNMRDAWKHAYEATEALKARAVSGRRPAEKTRKVIGTRQQLRAVCPCCFRQHAIKGDKIVDHGFQLQWEARQGSCYGYGKPHFGTEAGRDFCAKLAAEYRLTAASRLATAEATLRGEVQLRDMKTLKWIEHPTERQLQAHAQKLRSEASGFNRGADEFEKRVRDWKPAEPVIVQVEVFE
jgi:hypothetical protein